MTIHRRVQSLLAVCAVLLPLSGCSTTPEGESNACPPACAGAASPPLGGGGTGGLAATAGVSGAVGTAGATAGAAGAQPTAGTPGSAGTVGAGTGGAAGADASGAGAAGAAGTPGMDDAGIAGAGGAAQPLPPITDYTEAGPFGTTMESGTGPGGGYAIFRPDPMGEGGFLHSPIIFGPGILTSPTSYRTLLTHLASHGFVSIVVNSLSGGPGAQANVDAMQEGLDWLIEQNGVAGEFEGKLAVDRAVTMGYSLGATASVQLSSHPAVITSVPIHGHNTAGDPHGPVLLITGTDDVIDSVRSTLATLEEAPAIMVALPIGHLAVLGELSATGRYIAPITAWLRYWVNGDENAKSFFWGSDCGMCSSPWITPETNALWDAQTL